VPSRALRAPRASSATPRGRLPLLSVNPALLANTAITAAGFPPPHARPAARGRTSPPRP
jgi:hypothetical protein